ncbi:formylglycine-generating enzyme family protein [Treponema vincentii]|nr:formylglycine-generating enzyme family protein [Treponema vincentii]
MKMIDIAAVTNGSVGDNSQSDNNVHTVSLTAYRIGETEVTQELWTAVMGENPSRFKGTGNPPDGSEVQEKRPVESVNWYHAIAFCNKLSKACGLEPCYTVQGVDFDALTFSAIPTSNNNDWNNAVCDWSKNGFRLPTEAEWEWAAMGGTEHKWAGTNVKGQLINYAWYSDSDGGNANNKTHEVKKKQANGYGLYDMSGNVWEWCWDRYSVLPNPMPPDYAGPADSGSRRVRRGGCWSSYAGGAARAFRGSNFYPVNRYYDLGLRVVSRP